jgi:glycosyltransferase involved in cell wall biosynthesis
MAESAEPQGRLFHAFSNFAFGGSQVRFVVLANALGRKYHHSILAMSGDYAATAALDRDVPYSIERMPVRKTGSISLANVRHARQALRRAAPDLLVTYNWGSIEWAIANFPSICRHIHIEDGFGPDESITRQKRSRVLARRYLLSRADRIIVPSTTLLALAVKTWRLPEPKVLYLPNGVDYARFARPADPALVASFGLDGPAPVVGTIASLRGEKNIARLVRIFATLPAELGARLVIVGDGPERAAIAQLVETLGVGKRTVMTGALRDPERIIGRFTVLGLSSDTEQMPNVVLEAMAAGVPIVATDVGDVRKMVSAENASFVVPPEDEAGFARAFEALLRDPARRQEIARSNERRVRAEYTLEAMVARYDALFSAGRK